MNRDTQAEPLELTAARRRLEKLAWLLDESFKLPGTNKRFGLDPLIGLIPGVGDVIGAGLSLYFIFEAARLGAPRSLQLRMAGNSLLEMAVGIVPLLGDLFDFYWKANSRNRQMLEDYINAQLTPPSPGSRKLTNWLLFAVIILLVFLLLTVQVPV